MKAPPCSLGLPPGERLRLSPRNPLTARTLRALDPMSWHMR